jgi:Na+(H+)/acetate symporter ActP
MNSRTAWKLLIIAFMVFVSVISLISIFQRTGTDFWSDPGMASVRMNYAAFNIIISAFCAIGAFGIYIEKEWGKGIVIGMCSALFCTTTIVPVALSVYFELSAREAISLEMVAVGIMSLAIGILAKRLPKILTTQP